MFQMYTFNENSDYLVPMNKNMNIALYTRPNDTLELFVIHIYQTGLTTSKISDLVERIYGIVNMTKQRFL